MSSIAYLALHPCSEASDWITVWVCLQTTVLPRYKGVCPSTFPVHWETECCFPSYSDSSPVLQESTRGLNRKHCSWGIRVMIKSWYCPQKLGKSYDGASFRSSCPASLRICFIFSVGNLSWRLCESTSNPRNSISWDGHSTDFSLLTMKPRASRRNINTSRCCIATSLDSDSRYVDHYYDLVLAITVSHYYHLVWEMGVH